MKLIVGIDPGVTTGLAIWEPASRKLHEVTSCSAIPAMRRVELMQRNGALLMVVYEDARRRQWYGDKGREALQGAGSIKRECRLWADWLGDIGCAYLAVSPQAKGRKLDAAQFARLTGWDGRTNEHGRDAAMLVFGRSALNGGTNA